MSRDEIPKSKLRYWWFRYTMASELYIVEKWEQITIHLLLGLFFVLFAYLNYAYVRHLPSVLMQTFGGEGNLPAHPVTTATLNLDKHFQGGITS